MPLPTEQEAKAAFDVALSNIESHALLLVRLGELLWHKLTSRGPYSDEDQSKYIKLVQFYKACTGKAEIPEQWKLDADGCPQYSASFADFAKELNHRVNALQDCHFKFKNQVIVMIDTIAGLFQSIQKRDGFANFVKKRALGAGEYRADGFEQMFFNELALWTSTILPLLPPDDERTSIELKKRIDYCEAVYKHVLIDRKDADKPNALNQLGIIIIQLRGMYSDTLKYSQAATFNQTVTRIGDEISEIVGQTFNICHLISEFDYPKQLLVTEYLSPQLKREKVDAHLNSLMARWMINTFKVAGVENNNFSNTKRIDLNLIPDYLRGDFPVDFSKVNLAMTGLPEFARLTPETAKIHLEKVAEMHRALLNLYHVRESLVIAAQVVAIYGEIWLYGDEEGKLVLDALLTVIKDVTAQHIEKITDFWTHFYGSDPIHPGPGSYLAFIKTIPQAKKEKYHEYLEAADKAFKEMVACNQNIQKKIDAIMQAAKNFEKDKESAKQKKQDLITRLYEYMEKMPGINPAQLAAIKSLSEQVKQPPGTTTKNTDLATGTTQAAIAPKPVVLKSTEARIFSRAKELLLEPFEEHGNTDFRLMPKPTEFYSNIQQDIYNGFLQPYHSPVNAWMIWTSLRFGITTEEMIKIRHAYTAVNSIMKMIYDRQEKPTKTAMSLVEKTEMDLVDQYLRQTMHDINHSLNRRNQNIKMTDTELKLFNVTKVGDNLEVNIDPVFLQYSSGLYAEQLKSVSDELDATKIVVATKESVIEAERAEKQQVQESKNQLAEAYQKQETELAKEKEQKLQLVAENKAKEDALQTELAELKKRELEQKLLIDTLRIEAEKKANQTNTPVQPQVNRMELEQISEQKDQVITKLRQELESKASQPSPTEAVLAQRLAELEEVNKALREKLEGKVGMQEPEKQKKPGFFKSWGSKKASVNTATAPTYQ